MKRLSQVLGIIVLIAFLTSCTGRRYSHLTGFKFQPKQKITKAETPRKVEHQTSPEFVQVDVLENSVAEIPTDTNRTIFNSDKRSSIKTLVKISPGKKLKVSPLKVAKTIAIAQPEKLAEIFDNVTSKPEKVDRENKSKSDADNLLYWILVIILILLILTLLRTILGGFLYTILVTVFLILLIGHLLGIW